MSNTLLVRKRENGVWEGIRKGANRASFLEDKKNHAVLEGNRYLLEYDNVEELIIYKSNGEVDKIKKAKKNTKNNYYKGDLTTTTIENENFTLSYTAWKEDTLGDRLTKKDKGCRVHVAGEKGTVQTFLKEVFEPGEEYYPKGGYQVQWKDKDYPTSHFYDEVRLHQEERKKRLRKQKS